MKKIWSWASTHVVETATLFIAICALFISVDQGLAARKHNRLSVFPILQFHQSNVKPGLYLQNRGLGPAVLTDMEMRLDDKYYLSVDGEKFSELVFDIISARKIDISGSDYQVTGFRGVASILPLGELELIRLENQSKLKEFNKLLGFIRLGVCFKSVYGDRAFSISEELSAPLDSCNYRGSFRLFGSSFDFRSPFSSELNIYEILSN